MKVIKSILFFMVSLGIILLFFGFYELYEVIVGIGDFKAMIYLIIFGLTFLIMAREFYCLFYRLEKKENEIEELINSGKVVIASFESVVEEEMMVEGEYRCKIICNYIDSFTNQEYKFHSDTIYYDVKETSDVIDVLGKKEFVVYCDHLDMNKYYVDVSDVEDKLDSITN